MGNMQVAPRPDSYVIEWEAVEITGPADYAAIKRLVRNTPWNVQVVLESDDTTKFVFTRSHGSGLEQWTLAAGEWLVKSPHGKFWFMGAAEFTSQFEVVAL